MEQLLSKITAVVQDLYSADVAVSVERPDVNFGDIATNIALQLAGRLGKNPRQIAQEIAGSLASLPEIDSAEVAGPGFINIHLSDQALLDLTLGSVPESRAGQNLVLEYSCPNAFKELHTGHLYQTVLGDTLARLLETSGATVHRTSFGGDVGLHVAKAMYGVADYLGGELPDKLASVQSDVFARASWISACYVRGAAAYENDTSAKQVIDELNKKIYGLHESEDHESDFAQIYWTVRQWSFDYFAAFYTAIKVDQQHYYPESSTAPIGMAVVSEQLAAGKLERSDGAVVFRGDEQQHLHTRVFVTSLGLPTYETKDIGVIWKEYEDYKFDQRYLITGNDQREYMRVVFAAAETFRPELSGKMTHITTGTVRFADGQKMSSRLGNVTRAVDVIEAVRDKVKKLVQDQAVVEVVTLGAIKYVFSKYKIGGDIAFDLDETVSLTGNSGPYLQYAHARARQVLAKAGSTVGKPNRVDPEDRVLVSKIGQYTEVVARAARDLEPHVICDYLFELAQEFNRYYEKNRVMGSSEQEHRLGLVGLYADTLKSGLALLGIEAPDRL